MNLKEFDAKQFLLEKGERVGLGIAVTLMVLMLIFSLFMPSKGFFSGSPSKNAEVLEQGSKQLQTALNTAQPGPNDLPGKTAGQLIALDTERLKTDIYEELVWFEPSRSDNPARRPPSIKNADEAAVQVVAVPIDSYIFNQKFDRIMVLKDQAGGGRNGGSGGGRNLGNMFKGVQPPGMGGGSAAMNRQRGQFRNLNARGVQGADEKPDYDTSFVNLADVDPNSAHLARQLRPARMAIIAASFPYKAQLDEFKSKLRLPSIQAVLEDTVEDGKDKLPAFRFLGVLVQREELDASGKVVSAWADMDLASSYKLWMMNSGLPFEPDDPKYEAIKPLFPGLVMPRLREFHEESQQNQMAMTPRGPGAPPQGAQDAPRKEGESKYPDVAGQLREITATLDKLAGATPKQIAAPPSKFRTQNFDPFNSQASAMAEGNEAAPSSDKPGEKADAAQDVVPEHCLVRLIDVTIDPGKFYKYRLKIKMANPNYNRADVASPAYKDGKELESKDWFELPQTVSVPTELFYYVVDQKHVKSDGPKGGDKPLRGTPMYDIWRYEPKADQVAFQFHRWVESTPVVSEGEPVPIGDWAVADRVFVARGEYVGQTVRVDLPVWKYTQDSYVLPAEDQKKRGQRKPPTGVLVSFGADNSDRETILVDFEGGKRFFELPAPAVEGAAPKPVRVDDVSTTEVVMLSPEGKLLARNSAADTNDEDRQKRRTKYLARIKEIREGKPGGPAGGPGGLDNRR